MEYAVVVLPAAPVRRRPMHRKEMTNQLLFGETVSILKTRGDLWVKIRSLHDGYEGWMTHTMLEEIDGTAANTPSVFATTGILDVVTLGDRKINIPVVIMVYSRSKLISSVR